MSDKLEQAVKKRIAEWQNHMAKARNSRELQQCDVVLTILQNILKEGEEVLKASSPALTMMIDAVFPTTTPGEIAYHERKAIGANL